MEEYHTGYESENPTKRDGITEIYFVGTGDIQFGYSDRAANKGIAANTGLGVLFWRIWQTGRELQLDAKINIASTVDTVSVLENNGALNSTRVFGRYALIPAGSGQATQINALYYFHRPPLSRVAESVRIANLIEESTQLESALLKNKGDTVLPSSKRLAMQDSLQNRQATIEYQLKSLRRTWKLAFISGLECNGAASNQVWAAATQTAGTGQHTARSVDVSTLAWRLGLFHDFMPQTLGRQKGYSIRLGLYAIGRSLQGDIGLRSEAMEKQRLFFLGGTKTSYWGGELALALRLKNIRAEAALPYLFRRSDENIPGLTGAQFVTSISFVGGFPLSISSAHN